MGLREQAAKGVAWSAFQRWGQHTVQLVTFLLLARLLLPEHFGIIALAGVVIALFQVLVDQGFTAALVQREELEDEHLDAAFWTNLSIGAVLAVGTVLLSGPISGALGEAELAPVLSWLSLSLVISGFSRVQEAVLRREMNFKSLSIRSLLAVFVGGIVGVVMALKGYGVWSLVGQQLTVRGVEVLVLWGVSRWRPRFRYSAPHARDLFSFGVNISGRNLLQFLSQHADNFLIGIFLGPVPLGFYHVAYRFLRIMMSLFTQTVGSVALPTYSRMQADPPRLKRAFHTASEMMALIGLPAFLGVLAVAPRLVEVAFGQKWLSSVPVMQVLTLIGVWTVMTFSADAVLLAVGRPSWSLWLMVARTSANLVAFVIAVPFGLVAVAVALVISDYLMLGPTLWAVKRAADIDVGRYFRGLMAPLLASLVMLGIVISAGDLLSGVMKPFYTLIAQIVLGIAVYGLIMRFGAPDMFRQAIDFARLAVPGGKSPAARQR